MQNYTSDNLSTATSALNIISISFGGIFTIGLCAAACYKKYNSSDKIPDTTNNQNHYKLFSEKSTPKQLKHSLYSKKQNVQPSKKRKLNPIIARG